MNPDTMLRDAPMLAMVLPVWNTVALRCAWFELQVRLVAGVTHPAESVEKTIGGKGGLLSLLFDGGTYEPAEQELLRSCTVIRNKLLHCELDALLKELQKVDPSFSPPRRAMQIPLGDAPSGADILEALETRKDAVDVQDTASRQDGFFGWMLEATSAGVFAKAIEVLERGITVVLSRRDQAAPS